MNRFLEKINLPRLNQEEMEIMSNPITSTETEAVIKNLPKNKSPEPYGLTGEFYQTERRANAYSSTTLSKKFRGRNTSKLILWGYHLPDTKIRQRQHTKKENCRPISLMNIDAKTLNKILANRIQEHLKKLTHHDQVGFNTLATWCEELTHLKRPWFWERLKVGGEGDNRGWDCWMASLTQWMWVWVNSGSWW